ncbi:hypothetical protein DOM22_12725 [Bdellovibrio sp. ZAP7]|uniref:hypothetical protein n=1 Tax=Bdellovibrio sp. ZAP7 TaxID=2231053 RepID=UPI001156FBEE|nr:hypothetical protein [Bdellovibrio sp. ZAP7]QDK45953.1 hypothetical protein DOM22_12725 [Bdellovibrio sp. ZAP7]
MKTAAITSLCLILILATKVFAQGTSVTNVSTDSEKKKFSAEWRLSMKGADEGDEQTQATYVDLRLEVKSKYILSNLLYIDLQPAIRLVSGQAQTLDGADNMKNSILLNQAGLMFKPASFFQLAAGALDQRYNHTSLLVDSIAFPSARMQSLFRVGPGIAGLVIESAIPTSTSLSTNTQEKEPTPSLNSASLRLNFNSSKNAFWKNKVGYFIYNNLPSAVAQQSMLLGNEVNTVSDAHYEFVNKYAGVEASTEMQIPLGTLLDITLESEYVKNTEAKEDVNTAYNVALGSILHVSSALDITLKGKYYSVAPEAAVSYFNSRGYETNRIGYEVSGYLNFLKQGYNLGASYKDAEVMFTNTVQSREKTIMIKLETSYANI